MPELFDPGWYANISLNETPGHEEAYLHVTKCSTNSEQFDDLKEGKASIIVTRKHKGKLKQVHIFHGSEACKIPQLKLMTFTFPKRFYTYFKNYGTKTTENNGYITAIYLNDIDATEFFDLMTFFHINKYVESQRK